MSLNGVMAVALHYFTDFGKPAFQHNGVDLWRNLYTSLLIVFCNTCTMSSVKKFTFAISSPGEFLVTLLQITDQMFAFDRGYLSLTD